MKLRVVNLPAIQSPLRRSPGFEKKGLSTHALDIMGLCEYGCRYCSSNSGNFLRINREKFADATEQQLGERVYPTTSPELTFHWSDIETRLGSELDKHDARWGEGKILVFSMLTDGFSPGMIARGITRRILEMVLKRTRFKIRVLTKNACVGLSSEWLDFFGYHRDRFLVGLSTGTLDDAWAKRVEINTSPPSQRIKALHRLQDAGILTYGMLCPIFPDAMSMDGSGVADLIEAIRPRRCVTVWAEPYNDRANWEQVRAGYDVGSEGYDRITKIFDGKDPELWSEYAIELLRTIRGIASRDKWSDRLIYLLYESGITQKAAESMDGLRCVSLQSSPGPDGRSMNPWIAAMQGDVIP